MLVRPEFSFDRPAIDAVLRAAFGRDDEVRIVHEVRARQAGFWYWSWVADDHGVIVGHALFSLVGLEPAVSRLELAALGPIGVISTAQRRGVGSALVAEGLKECAELTVDAVFVLGDPAYYRRFGFELAAPRGFHFESHEFDAAFQVLELRAGSLDGHRGWVQYDPAFTGGEAAPRESRRKGRTPRSPRPARKRWRRPRLRLVRTGD